MPKRIEYKKGQVINGITFINELEPYVTPSNGKLKRLGIFKCSCGNIFETRLSSIASGSTKSCSCYNKKRTIETNTKHNLAKQKIYTIWQAQKSRCYYKKNIKYSDYGGRGITMSDEFKNDFKVWFDYVALLPDYNKKGYTIDRIDNDKGYFKGNLRWADYHTQTMNARMQNNNTSGYIGISPTYSGSWKCELVYKGEKLLRKVVKTKKEAVELRNEIIIENNLTEYKIQNHE